MQQIGGRLQYPARGSIRGQVENDMVRHARPHDHRNGAQPANDHPVYMSAGDQSDMAVPADHGGQRIGILEPKFSP